MAGKFLLDWVLFLLSFAASSLYFMVVFNFVFQSYHHLTYVEAVSILFIARGFLFSPNLPIRFVKK